MPDHMDQIQDLVLAQQQDAVAKVTQRIRLGLAECEECGAPIAANRQALGARLCMRDQLEFEAAERRRKARGCR